MVCELLACHMVEEWKLCELGIGKSWFAKGVDL